MTWTYFAMSDPMCQMKNEVSREAFLAHGSFAETSKSCEYAAYLVKATPDYLRAFPLKFSCTSCYLEEF